jgi:enoyl-CoA hydratase/carnithine racemase
MSDTLTERTGKLLRVELNRPAKKNAMNSRMYVTLADIFNNAAKEEGMRIVLWHVAGDSFWAGNDVQDFVKTPAGPGEEVFTNRCGETRTRGIEHTMRWNEKPRPSHRLPNQHRDPAPSTHRRRSVTRCCLAF